MFECQGLAFIISRLGSDRALGPPASYLPDGRESFASRMAAHTTEGP